jgi:diguanylate cyclase (GGDEF)-like protein/PAS domain S-box-containing protein
VVLVARDTTQRRRSEFSADEHERFRALVQNSTAITMLVDRHGLIASCSGAFARVLGHDPGTVIGTELPRWAVATQETRLDAAIADATRTAGTTTFDATLQHRDPTRTVTLEFSVVNLLDDPVVEGLVVTAFDVTPLRKEHASLTYLATHDPLTGLANRTLFVERLGEALGRAPSRGPVTLFFVDLDRFKRINDGIGHEAGDTVLKIVAERLDGVARATDVVARTGGDEFVILSERVADDDDARTIAERIETTLAQPITLGAGPTQVSASVGFARSTPNSTPDALLAQADGAMYVVKASPPGSSTTSCASTTSRSWTCAPAPWPGSRPSCAGSTPSTASCTRATSWASPRRRASTSPWARPSSTPRAPGSATGTRRDLGTRSPWR